MLTIYSCKIRLISSTSSVDIVSPLFSAVLEQHLVVVYR